MVARAFETRRLVQESTQSNDLLEEQGDLDSIIGRCDAMQEVYKQIGRVAPQDVTVLITGESGTGKELVAQAIWKHSRRSNGPFRALNCAAIPESLLESELFGHEAGAFTGADQRVIGKFEQCNGGTLFLDEIADMTSLSQAKMLRVLQNHQFERIGGCETIQADVRIVAATSRDLMQSVADGGFRKELYFRLSVFSIELPPLRARGDDLMLLAHHFLRRYSLTFGKKVRQIPQETSDLLHRHSWPGNVRELEGVVQQSLLSAVGTTLLPEFLPLQLRRSGLDRLGAAETSRGYVDLDRAVADRMRHGSQNIHAEVLEIVERHLVQHLLEITNGNQSQAAKLLGITRKTLRSKIRSLGISLKWLHRDHPDG